MLRTMSCRMYVFLSKNIRTTKVPMFPYTVIIVPVSTAKRKLKNEASKNAAIRQMTRYHHPAEVAGGSTQSVFKESVVKVCSKRVQSVFKSYSKCVQSVFKVCSKACSKRVQRKCVQSVFKVCSRCAQSVFKVYSKCAQSKCVQSVFKVCSKCVPIATPGGSTGGVVAAWSVLSLLAVSSTAVSLPKPSPQQHRPTKSPQKETQRAKQKGNKDGDGDDREEKGNPVQQENQLYTGGGSAAVVSAGTAPTGRGRQSQKRKQSTRESQLA